LYSIFSIIFSLSIPPSCPSLTWKLIIEEDGSAGNVVLSLPIERRYVKYRRACNNMEPDISKTACKLSPPLGAPTSSRCTPSRLCLNFKFQKRIDADHLDRRRLVLQKTATHLYFVTIKLGRFFSRYLILSE